MTIAYWCILVAAVLPIVCAGIAKSGTFSTPRSQGGYDNHDPREWLARQTGYRKRADNAQANTFEALPFFFAAVLAAHQMQAPQALVDALAVVFVVLRIAYVWLYVADRAGARSIVWTLAFLVNTGLLLAGLWR